MRKLRYPIIVAVAGLLIASAGQVLAGGSDSCCSGAPCNDRVAASPKLRMTLEERCRSRCAPQETATATASIQQPGVAASPKLQQMLAEQTAIHQVQTSQDTQPAAYRPTGTDGITASPKLRTQLDERRQTVEIAPLK